MATFYSLSPYGVNVGTLNLNRLIAASTGNDFSNDAYLAVNNHVYEDVLAIGYYAGGYRVGYFAGTQFSFTGQSVTGGTVKGYAEGYWDGYEYLLQWGIENVSIPAISLYNAAVSPGTSDDYALFTQALAGNDTFNLSASRDAMRGYGGNDRMFGNGGNDSLDGGSGNDSIYGGTGYDSLVGGSGSDRFIFNAGLAGGNVDTIRDFLRGTDKIVLDDDVFTVLAGTSTGKAASAVNLRIGSAAADSNDFLIYNPATDKLYYDADANGPLTAILFATVTLPGSTPLAASDFLLVS